MELTETWAQVKGGKGGVGLTRDRSDTGTWSGFQGDRRDLGSRSSKASKGSIDTSGGGHRVGEMYMWTVSPSL